jgi:hypothetical protein
LIINKLLEDKRYNDCIKIFFDATANGKFPIDPATKKLRIPNDTIRLVAEALHHLNNAEAIEKTKNLFELCSANEKRIPPMAVANLVMLAVNQV